jgi:type II secretory pathway component GspD/PulD (secretin)
VVRLPICFLVFALFVAQSLLPLASEALAQGGRRWGGGERGGGGERFRGGGGGDRGGERGPGRFRGEGEGGNRDGGIRGDWGGNGDAPAGDEGTDEAKKEEPKVEVPAGPPSITRDQVQPPSGPRITLAPGEDGRLKFNFRGESWPSILQWLAETSGMSLDWQELPGDFLNLETQRSYTLDEARDLINMHLLARGFTMLKRGEVLSVVKLDKLNASLVPYVEPADLAKRDMHEFVRTTFKLDWLVADSAAQELKPLLSPFGKLAPMKATNRLEAIDAVVNLRELANLLEREQSGGGQERLVEEFKLRHARAIDASDKLRALLGMDKPRDPNSFGQMRMAMEETRMKAEMVKQLGKDAPGVNRQQPEVYMAVNEQENSILVNAPPDKMALIRQALQALDAQPQNARSPLQAATRMRVYRLPGLDPERVVQLLNNLRTSGDLDAGTRLEADEDNHALIAYAAPTDQMLIGAIISQLDAAGRKFEVIPLANLDAVEVAGTVEYMLGAPAAAAESEGRGGGWRRREERQTPQDQFRVEADVERNQLLVWATDAELSEVQALLTKLDARTGPRGDANVRVIRTPGDTDELLRQLEKLWPTVGDNRLEVVPREAKRPRRDADRTDRSNPPLKEVPARMGSQRKEEAADKGADDVKDRSASKAPRSRTPVMLAMNPTPQAAAAQPPAESRNEEPANESPVASDTEEPAAETVDNAREEAAPAERGDEPADDDKPADDGLPGAPVRVTEGPNGQMIITSPDAEALDRVERLLQELSPAEQDFRLFRLRHAWAPTVRLNLEEVFGVTPATAAAGSTYGRSYGGESYGRGGYGGQRGYGGNGGGFGRGAAAATPTQRLSRRAPLKFISDLDSNTILVQHASPEQLRTIEELIEFYDQPEPEDSQSARRTEIVQIEHSKATQVADVVKEVFRDLLSENDKALSQPGQQGGRGGEQRRVMYLGGELSSTKKPQYKGQLSVGIDAVSNQLIISAPEFVIRDVLDLVKQVDRAASERNVAVVPLGGQMQGANMREVLARVLGQQAGGTSTATANRGSGGQGGGGQQRFGQQGGGGGFRGGQQGGFGNRGGGGFGGR